jgi:hypothetical protein
MDLTANGLFSAHKADGRSPRCLGHNAWRVAETGLYHLTERKSRLVKEELILALARQKDLAGKQIKPTHDNFLLLVMIFGQRRFSNRQK